MQGFNQDDNYDTRLSSATVYQSHIVNVQHYNDKQVHSIIVLHFQGLFYVKFLGGRAATLGGDYRSIVLELGAFDSNYIAAIGRAIAQEQATHVGSGMLERRSSYLAQLITSGKMPLIEARGIEFQDQAWVLKNTTSGCDFTASYFYNCKFRNLQADRANFSQAHFRSCLFENKISFRAAIFYDAKFTDRCSMDSSVVFSSSDCRRADFGDTVLNGDFSGADLREVMTDTSKVYVNARVEQTPLWNAVYEQLHRPDYNNAKMFYDLYSCLKAIDARISFFMWYFIRDGSWSAVILFTWWLPVIVFMYFFSRNPLYTLPSDRILENALLISLGGWAFSLIVYLISRVKK